VESIPDRAGEGDSVALHDSDPSEYNNCAPEGQNYLQKAELETGKLVSEVKEDPEFPSARDAGTSNGEGQGTETGIAFAQPALIQLFTPSITPVILSPGKNPLFPKPQLCHT